MQKFEGVDDGSADLVSFRCGCANGSYQGPTQNGSLIAAVSSGIAICPSGVMVLYEVARCAS